MGVLDRFGNWVNEQSEAVGKLGDELDKVAADAAKVAAASKASTDAVQGIAGSYRDAAGKLRAVNGRFLSGKEIAAAAAPALASVGDQATVAAKGVSSLSDEFDALLREGGLDDEAIELRGHVFQRGGLAAPPGGDRGHPRRRRAKLRAAA